MGSPRVVRRWPVILIGCLYGVCAIWLLASRVEILWSSLMLPALGFAGLTGLFLSLRLAEGRAQSGPLTELLPMLRSLTGCLLFMQWAWLPLRVLNHLGMTTALPYQDALLADWDRALNFDWPGYFGMVAASLPLIQVLDVSYTSLTPVSILALLALVAARRPVQARLFVESFLVTAMVCIVVGPVFPALGAVAYHGITAAEVAAFPLAPGVYHLPHMDALRAATGPIVLDAAYLPGLVTFPSFHTAVGVLLILVCRGTWMMIPASAYSVIMIASTPIFGGHFIIDLPAGALAALAGYAVAIRLGSRTTSR
ncbi:MAG: phosphatase PAP2 family protein [Pseudomonadota bacterium]